MKVKVTNFPSNVDANRIYHVLERFIEKRDKCAVFRSDVDQVTGPSFRYIFADDEIVTGSSIVGDIERLAAWLRLLEDTKETQNISSTS